MVSQSMQASVTDTPYCSCARFAGIGWLPACRWLSIIMPTIACDPSFIWCTQSIRTSGCSDGSLSEFACEQSTTMLAGSFAFCSARSASFTLTVS